MGCFLHLTKGDLGELRASVRRDPSNPDSVTSRLARLEKAVEKGNISVVTRRTVSGVFRKNVPSLYDSRHQKLSPQEWPRISRESRETALRDVAKPLSGLLGMKEAPSIQIVANYPKETVASWDPADKVIRINKHHLENGSAEELVGPLAQEIFHAYQTSVKKYASPPNGSAKSQKFSEYLKSRYRPIEANAEEFRGWVENEYTQEYKR